MKYKNTCEAQMRMESIFCDAQATICYTHGARERMRCISIAYLHMNNACAKHIKHIEYTNSRIWRIMNASCTVNSYERIWQVRICAMHVQVFDIDRV